MGKDRIVSAIPQRVSLIGYRGTGKTTVARLLAERFGLPWYDADAVLEAQAGRTVREVFATEGEPAFRDREAAVLAELLAQPRLILATGGGVILRPENRHRLVAAGPVIWLTADADTLWQRLQTDPATGAQRPALTSLPGREEIHHLLRVREPFYRECATFTLDTAPRTPTEVAQVVGDWLTRQP